MLLHLAPREVRTLPLAALNLLRERDQFGRARHEPFGAHPMLGGGFKQVFRHIYQIERQQLERLAVGFEISLNRRAVAQAQFPDNPADGGRNFPRLLRRGLL